jgi:hypothetical protein
VRKQVLDPDIQVCIISDRHRGLLNGAKDHLEGYPPLIHMWCSRYFAANIWKKQWSKEVIARLSYPVFIPKPSTHHMHDPRSIVPQIRPKVFTDNQMSRIEYNYYINSVSKDYDDSQWNGTAKDSITPQERQSGQHVA